MPPEPPVLACDDLVGGRYRLERRIARGGMAEVWEAEDTILARPVAVKALLPHLAADEAVLTRFRREAVAAARLSHPHIVSIYDTCGGGDYEAIVMELVRGPTLRDVLDQSNGALAPRRAVDIVVQVADALEHAHGCGLIHRDVKPGNILLSEDGRVLVADFGIAKAMEGMSDLTEVGQVVGTAKYLSPEQVRGEPLDARSDVYALGVVLYELLCGRAPFNGESSTATAVARLTTDPLRPRQVRAGIPRQLDDVVMRALARSTAARFQTADDFRRALLDVDLSRVEDDSDHHTRVFTPVDDDTGEQPAGFAASERSWLVPAALILVVALTLGVVGVLLGRTSVGQDLFDAVGGNSASHPVRVTAHAFDPFGGGDEHDEIAPLAVDGNATTAWHTQTYQNGPKLAPFKPGVGLVLAAAQALDMKELRVLSPGTGWRAAIYVADGSSAPSTLAGWGEPVANITGTGREVTASLGGATARYVLVWITDLGRSAGGGYRFSLAEAKLSA
jgi:hypothetical protein